jgi:cytochrome c biogenesis protein CcmG/thiol:disulfide interchange protein DsbE
VGKRITIAIAVTLALAAGWLAWGQTNQPPARAGTIAPRFVLRDADHQQWRLADFEGRSVLFAFLLVRTKTCQEQLPVLVELQSRYGGERFSVVGLALDEVTDATNSFRSLLATNQVNFPVLFADYDTIAGFGGLTGVPTMILAEPNHGIVTQYLGVTDKATMEPVIRALVTR